MTPKNQSMLRHNLFILIFLSITISGFSQYTETINSNRPGNSQGAFSVGRNIIQLETGLKLGNDKHELLNYDSSIFGAEAFARYGLLWEQLELSLAVDYLSENRQFTTGSMQKFRRSNFNRLGFGAKYLIYDPYKNGPDKPNLYSWKANQRFKWKTLIPAISIYAGANFNLDENNPFAVPNEGLVTPRIELITQNNWSGGWVFVMNIIADKVTTDFPTYAGIFTLTHSFSSKFAGFLEYQAIKSDIYSDNIARGGVAFLFSKDFQIDASGLVNFKDTPSRWQVALGASYRINLRSDTDDVILEEGGRRVKKNKKRKDTEFEDDGDDGDDGGFRL